MNGNAFISSAAISYQRDAVSQNILSSGHSMRVSREMLPEIGVMDKKAHLSLEKLCQPI
jgi:hypothetical protein